PARRPGPAVQLASPDRGRRRLIHPCRGCPIRRDTDRGMTTNDGQADLVLINGKVRTPVQPGGFAAALAARDGLIQAVGAEEDIRALTGPGTRVVDLDGR